MRRCYDECGHAPTKKDVVRQGPRPAVAHVGCDWPSTGAARGVATARRYADARRDASRRNIRTRVHAARTTAGSSCGDPKRPHTIPACQSTVTASFCAMKTLGLARIITLNRQYPAVYRSEQACGCHTFLRSSVEPLRGSRAKGVADERGVHRRVVSPPDSISRPIARRETREQAPPARRA